MKACTHCGYTFEHDPEVCKVLIAEKKEPKRKMINPGRGAGTISRENVLKLADYLKGMGK